jgi:hypothetical protein
MSLTGCGVTQVDTTSSDGVVVESTANIEEDVTEALNAEVTDVDESETDTTEVTEDPAESDEIVAGITEAMELKEVSATNEKIRYNIGVRLLAAVNNMRVTGETEDVVDALVLIYRWIYEETTYVSNNFSTTADDVIFASSSKDRMYVDEESFYEDYLNSTVTKTLKTQKTGTVDAMNGDLKMISNKKELISMCDTFISSDVINAQYEADNGIVQFVPSDASNQNDYSTYITNMLDDTFDEMMDELKDRVENEAFKNGLTRDGSMSDSFLVSEFEFSKSDVKRYMNYYYNYMISQYTANQGSLDKPIGLHDFGYSIEVDDSTKSDADKKAASQDN